MPGVTRLAPSPTGALHLGNARTFLATWAIARQRGMRLVLRIEDIDGPRIKPGAEQETRDDLRWLGLDHDGPIVRQSERLAHYRDAVDRLTRGGFTYPCVCTRKEIEQSSSAPHAEDGAAVYPGTCRGRFKDAQHALDTTGRAPAIRFAMPDRTLRFDDRFAGAQSFDLQRELGDFVLAKPDGSPSYQLAVVVDDLDAGVTDVIRADDLISSTPKQILLYDALGHRDRTPTYTHLPLVVGADGRRLAKRHGDTRLSFYREQGVPADRLRALLARWLGIDTCDTITPREVVERFDLSRVPRDPVVMTRDDDAWLRSRS